MKNPWATFTEQNILLGEHREGGGAEQWVAFGFGLGKTLVEMIHLQKWIHLQRVMRALWLARRVGCDDRGRKSK